MLVLKHNIGDSVTLKIGDQVVKIKFIEVRGRSVRLGYNAAKEVRILRDNAKNKTV